LDGIANAITFALPNKKRGVLQNKKYTSEMIFKEVFKFFIELNLGNKK